ncbi:hypothetical protein [Brucella haematophila]|uniref:hypothetical protein n=1 Tax=Brucella haematophila TaxID=419474 RepID=UPI00110D4A4B|nr:hypothetical protein [Brucella haematophila]TMV03144.1 hypothetical protein FGI60_12070 [Brucella haematophila]
MLDTIKKIIKGGDAQTSETLKAALAKIDLAKLQSDLDAARGERARLLLEGTDADIQTAEQKIDAARIALDRGRAASEEITARIGKAEQNEAEDAFQAERAAVEKKADDAAKNLAKVYPEASKVIIQALELLMQAQAEVDNFNSRCIARERADDRIDDVENRAWGETDWRRYPQYGVIANTSLRPTPTTPGFGSGRQQHNR